MFPTQALRGITSGDENTCEDGTITLAKFSFPRGLAFDDDHNLLYVSDINKHIIRVLDFRSNIITTLAGGIKDEYSNGSGFADGPFSKAKFRNPAAICLHNCNKILIVCDEGNARIRKLGLVSDLNYITRLRAIDSLVTFPPGVLPLIISYLEPHMVSTWVGDGTYGMADGKGHGATISSPFKIISALDDHVFFVDLHFIRSISPDGTVKTLAGGIGFADGFGTSAHFNCPFGLAFDNLGRIIIADAGNRVIRRVTREGHVTTLIDLKDCKDSSISDEDEAPVASFVPSKSSNYLYIATNNSVSYVNETCRVNIYRVNLLTKQSVLIATYGDIGAGSDFCLGDKLIYFCYPKCILSGAAEWIDEIR